MHRFSIRDASLPFYELNQKWYTLWSINRCFSSRVVEYEEILQLPDKILPFVQKIFLHLPPKLKPLRKFPSQLFKSQQDVM
ncbi:hypothetical protein J437_LFUL019297 [Ladona fulva]|uniref:Uncharacterized protein n=1 Tax=Ladona fulva TaxID=123851 RepID=A0A8K0KSB4_LADFU|nr:hypothetical protein J437_LFUL019297 [Ladona fulva]